MQKTLGIICSLFLALAPMALPQVKDDVKEAGQATGRAAKDTGKKVKKTTKKGVNKSANAVEKGAGKVKKKTEPK